MTLREMLGVRLPRRWERMAVFLLPRVTGGWVWVETALISLAAIGLGWLVDPADPLHVASEFPWPWLAPVLLALRYGLISGLASAVILLVAWFALQPTGIAATPPKLYFLGGLLLVMVCGEYSGVWRMRLRRMAEVNKHLEDRVEGVTKRLYLLRLSHERLEQDLLSRPTTLRDALADLRRRLIKRAGSGPLPGAEELLQFIAQTCQLELAAIYRELADDPPRYERVAAIGEPPAIERSDALLAYVQERGELAHVQLADIDQTLPTQHLVVAPIRTSAGERLGMLVVTRMPFFALNEDTLQLVAVLLAVYADGIESGSAVLPVLAALPGCPVDFATELAKLQRIEREFGAESHVVALAFGDHPFWADAYQLVMRQRRTPDLLWTPPTESHRSLLINLMPFAGRAAVEGYLLRIEEAIQESFGHRPDALRIRTTVIALSEGDPVPALQRLLRPTT
jgi:hypothetical protein